MTPEVALPIRGAFLAFVSRDSDAMRTLGPITVPAKATSASVMAAQYPAKVTKRALRGEAHLETRGVY